MQLDQVAQPAAAVDAKEEEKKITTDGPVDTEKVENGADLEKKRSKRSHSSRGRSSSSSGSRRRRKSKSKKKRSRSFSKDSRDSRDRRRRPRRSKDRKRRSYSKSSSSSNGDANTGKQRLKLISTFPVQLPHSPPTHPTTFSFTTSNFHGNFHQYLCVSSQDFQIYVHYHFQTSGVSKHSRLTKF